MDKHPSLRSVRLTSVFGSYSKSGFPFVNTAQAQVSTFLTKAWQKYKGRWVWAFNVYPYWDKNCGASFGAGVPGGMQNFRQRVTAITKSTTDTLWMSETGWSSAPPGGFHDPCPGYSSVARLRAYYEGFMRWDMSSAASGGTDHGFYFTMRDAMNFN